MIYQSIKRIIINRFKEEDGNSEGEDDEEGSDDDNNDGGDNPPPPSVHGGGGVDEVPNAEGGGLKGGGVSKFTPFKRDKILHFLNGLILHI